MNGVDAAELCRSVTFQPQRIVPECCGSLAQTWRARSKLCRDAPKGSTVLYMLADPGERCFGTLLFADVPVDMAEEEIAIMKSTP